MTDVMKIDSNHKRNKTTMDCASKKGGFCFNFVSGIFLVVSCETGLFQEKTAKRFHGKKAEKKRFLGEDSGKSQLHQLQSGNEVHHSFHQEDGNYAHFFQYPSPETRGAAA